MSDRRVTNIRVSWIEFRSKGDGVEMEVVGHTEGDKAHQINVTMGVEYLTYIANSLHAAVDAKQEQLDRVKSALVGRD